MVWWDTVGCSARTSSITVAVSTCGWSRCAASTANRGRVTRNETARNCAAKSDVSFGSRGAVAP